MTTRPPDRTFDPYDRLLEERIVVLGTRIDETAVNDVTAQLIYLEHHSPDRDISLYVNSPGGPFHAMSALHDALTYLTCDVETVCLGRAEGTAALLLAAGTPGKRYVLPGSRLVLRQPALPEPAEGSASDLAIRADELARIRARTEELLARHTGRPADRVRADLERDLFLDAEAAVEYGLADRIVPHRRAARTATGAR
ncbi:MULTISPECIES: ATP-dependent Clp protease proteolytic subunit [Streptomyces]|jgi:ATP-dependent Clp protease protease subunit|uniref:ATP-dependent Clp protease proteolytic subunit n=1 Tax=Streptomyces thermocarboxydus TaxID=59299 RepID=A0ABU3JBR5_9ACTN|nr:ATP-dependent Clp protease proteolytic subunit [Streptomyces sp. McG7]MBT2905661.1 ATP-dependent Clp protease proteolytic subunit [Streptomyces sp. McG8]MDT6972506.1 ATP-dependent Clp protease proteolytic subunit [Streptomyces thermocarboxydus]WTB85241.1 ATP-dependent Clp protease proteolytic subunit [Streptomyces cellulosae]WUC41083.1 ATP-dependent Clp protease proteolytic subunit [Streptomyces cellulosae]